MVALAHASNVLGTNPIAAIAEMAHRYDALLLVDGAQSVPHMPVDVGELGCDFLAFSAHKMAGPTGIGALWGRPELLDAMDPYMGGGSMISRVTMEGATWADLPEKFEAGTPNIADAIGFGAAIDYLEALGMDNVRAYEKEITGYAMERLGAARRDGLRPEEPGGPRGRRFLQPPGRPSARREPDTRPVRRGDSCRSPLCPAAHAAARLRRHGARQLLPLQHEGRSGHVLSAIKAKAEKYFAVEQAPVAR